LDQIIAFQDYRRQLMIIISTAEASYWNLYLIQEQSRFFQESVATAEKVVKDNRERLHAGKSAEIEVLEAEAGLALRRSRLSEAEQKRYEAASKVLALYSETPLSTNRGFFAADRPQFVEKHVAFFDAWKASYEWNPDYLSQRHKVMQEYVREGYALNQRLPELNVKGSYGLNGLGETPWQSWEDIENADFPSWSVGFELRIPLGGGIKTANELAAARLRRKEALLALKEIETQIANALDTSLHKLTSTRDTVQSAETAVRFNQNLLESALARLEVGKLESRKVFDVEADLFESRNAVIEGLVNYQRALLELELVEGTTLKHRNIEISQHDLESRTMHLAGRIKLGEESYRQFIKDVQEDYEQKPQLPEDTPAQKKAREGLYQYMNRWDGTNTPAPKAAPAKP
jgi:outer membrane protein TolC